MIKQMLIGVVLVGSGGVAGYFISRKVLDKQYQCDIAEVKQLYQEKLEELDAMIESVDARCEALAEDEEETEEEREAREIVSTYRGERRRSIIEYNKPSLDSFKAAMEEMYHEGDEDGDEEEEEDDEDDEEHIPSSEDPEYEAELEERADEYARRRIENEQNDRPYLIEPEEYHEDGPDDYERQTLYYYADDRTLCEDDDTEVDDEEECVGFDYEDKLDMQTTCWVRNDQLRVLYEIHRIDDAYSSAVKNVSETPREREFRLQGRRKQAMDNRK